MGDARGAHATYVEPRWDATDAATAPDINNTVLNGRECAFPQGYLAGDPDKWIPEVEQWSGIGLTAYACAPDEFIESSDSNLIVRIGKVLRIDSE